jgi:hypothetical protein
VDQPPTILGDASDIRGIQDNREEFVQESTGDEGFQGQSGVVAFWENLS